MDFSTTIPTVPAAPVLTEPKNDIGTNYTPTYKWGKLASATHYHLYVAGPSGLVKDQWYPSADICDLVVVGECSVVSPTLGGGAHVWYVQAYNSAGYGPWSNNTQPTNFNTTIPTVPAAPVLTEPKNDIGTNYTPTYKWGKLASATHYRLYVAGPSVLVKDQWYPSADICDLVVVGECSVVSPTLGGGAHVWYVQAYNSAGYGPWSNNTQPTNFNTTIPTVPVAATLTAPIGTITSHTPTYTWSKVSMATWYRLYVKGPSGLVKDQWYQTVAVCNTTTCSVPGPSLESGDHIWWIQTYNVAGYGPWKSATFKVNP
jgi:hypothetical protein